MLFLLWIFNFGISALNAWGCGKSWTESKFNGGVMHFMNWMGAIMSACGFTWCYALLTCYVGSQFTHEVNGHIVPYLSAAQVTAVESGGYLIIIFPILGSGLAITVHSWVTFWRNRTIGSGINTGWNTFAECYNMYGAVKDVPLASKGFFSFLDDAEDKSKLLVIVLILTSTFAGILTTYTILTTTARNTARDRALKYANEMA